MGQYQQQAKIFKALCDPKRLAILALLRKGERCACHIKDETGIAQSALSYHMKILCESKIVIARQDGKWINYRISQTGSDAAKALLGEITAFDESNCGCHSE